MEQIPSIYLVSLGSAVIAVIGFFLANRIIKPIDLDEHQNFLNAMLSIVGTLVSILLGLLVAAALEHYQVLEQSVDTESSSLAQVFRISLGLKPIIARKIQDLCIRYSEEVIADEWPAMAQGQASDKVMLTYAKLVISVASLKPADDGESNIHSALLTSIQSIGDARRQRILVLHSTWMNHLMPVLLMCSVIVLVFAYLYVRRGAVLHGILICFVAMALGGNIGLVFLLSNPFSGDWKIQPRGFELNLATIKRLKSSPEVQQLLKFEPEQTSLPLKSSSP